MNHPDDPMNARLLRERDASRTKLDELAFAVITGNVGLASQLAHEHVEREWNGPGACWAKGIPPYTAAWGVLYRVTNPNKVFSVDDLISFNAACTFACWVNNYLAPNEFAAFSEAHFETSFYVPRICVWEKQKVRAFHQTTGIQRTNGFVRPAPPDVLAATRRYHQASHGNNHADEMHAAEALCELGMIYGWPQPIDD